LPLLSSLSALGESATTDILSMQVKTIANVIVYRSLHSPKIKTKVSMNSKMLHKK